MKTIKTKKIADNRFSFSHWSTVAPTYPEAVQKALDALAATRPFYNWLEGQIDTAHLRETPEKSAAITACTTKGLVTVEVQTGYKWRGKSVSDVRRLYTEGEFGLGAYEVACMLLADPSLLQSFSDLGMDCPGDEWSPRADGVFSKAPLLGFGGGEVGFAAHDVSDAGVRFGSASAFLPQSILAPRPLDSSESLTLSDFISDLEALVKKYKK